jgi:hypothetical protein
MSNVEKTKKVVAPKLETTGQIIKVSVTGFRHAEDWCVLNGTDSAGAPISCICGHKDDYSFRDLMMLKGSNAAIGVIDTGQTVTLKTGEVRKKYYFAEWSLL